MTWKNKVILGKRKFNFSKEKLNTMNMWNVWNVCRKRRHPDGPERHGEISNTIDTYSGSSLCETWEELVCRQNKKWEEQYTHNRCFIDDKKSRRQKLEPWIKDSRSTHFCITRNG